MARGRTTQNSDAPVDTQPEFATVDDFPASRSADRSTELSSRDRGLLRRTRAGTVVLTVFLLELVIIAAGANQAVSRHTLAYANDHSSTLLGGLARSALAFSWRFTPETGQQDPWLAQFVAVVAFFVLSVLLVLTVVRGPVTWTRAFFGIWTTISVSAALAVVAAGLAFPGSVAACPPARHYLDLAPTGPACGTASVTDRAQVAVFGGLTSYALVAGVILGFVVALITSLVAIGTRRTVALPAAAVPPAAQPPEAPEPFFGATTEPRRAVGYPGADSDTTRYAAPERAPATSGYAAGSASSGYGYAAAASDDTTALPRAGADDPAADETAAMRGWSREADEDAAPRSERTEPSERAEPFERAGRDEASSDAAGTTSELPVAQRAAYPKGSPTTDERTQAWPAQPPAEESSEADGSSRPEGSSSADGSSPSAERTEDAETTAAFPIPPDDEDLGHRPHDRDD